MLVPQSFAQTRAGYIGQVGTSLGNGQKSSLLSDASTSLAESQSGSDSFSRSLPKESAAQSKAVDNSSNEPTAVVSAASAAAAAVASGDATGPSATPNFTKIYGFFASLFNPEAEKIVEDVIPSLENSTLDAEIIKLLVKNLEINLNDQGFREQLNRTCRDQQDTLHQQQHQLEQHSQNLGPSMHNNYLRLDEDSTDEVDPMQTEELTVFSK